MKKRLRMRGMKILRLVMRKRVMMRKPLLWIHFLELEDLPLGPQVRWIFLYFFCHAGDFWSNAFDRFCILYFLLSILFKEIYLWDTIIRYSHVWQILYSNCCLLHICIFCCQHFLNKIYGCEHGRGSMIRFGQLCQTLLCWMFNTCQSCWWWWFRWRFWKWFCSLRSNYFDLFAA